MKKIYRVINQNVKRELLGFIANMPVSEINPFMVRISDEIRTLDQNAMLWPMLECFAEQRQWPVNGVMTYMQPEDWKNLLTASYRKESQRIASGIDGGMVMLGMRTSKMTKSDFSEFIEYLHAAAVQLGVTFERERLVGHDAEITGG